MKQWFEYRTPRGAFIVDKFVEDMLKESEVLEATDDTTLYRLVAKYIGPAWTSKRASAIVSQLKRSSLLTQWKKQLTKVELRKLRSQRRRDERTEHVSV